MFHGVADQGEGLLVVGTSTVKYSAQHLLKVALWDHEKGQEKKLMDLESQSDASEEEEVSEDNEDGEDEV